MTTLVDIKDYQTSTGSAYLVFPKLQSDNYFSWYASMESVLRSLNQWEVVMGTYTLPPRVNLNAPMEKELQMEKVWDLRRVRAYTEIDLWVEDQECVSIRNNRDPSAAWIMLRTVYGNRLANTRVALLAEITCARYNGAGILEH